MSPPTPGLGLGQDWSAVLKRSTFGPSVLLLPARARADLALFYGFCRAIDDCADEFDPRDARGHLDLWRRELALLRRGRPASDLGKGLLELCSRRGIPEGLLMDLWRGAASDAVPRVRFRTWAQLRSYCYHVAGSVGLVCLPIFGLDPRSVRDYALDLGEAFQIINILRDAREDAGRGRLYFAQDDLRAFGLREEEFMGGRGGARAERLIHAYAWRARAALARADQAVLGLPAKGLRPTRVMRALYTGLLEAMAADSFRVFELRYSLGPWRKRFLAVRGICER